LHSSVGFVAAPRRAAPRARTAIQGLLRAFLVWALAFPAIAARAQDDPADLADKKLEDLMNIEVTTASKTEQKLSETANAIFVITQEDIRNSGANNVPDLLRMVPGLDVAQINASNWAISARGLNSEFANELLVLVDGRSVYTPLTGGVYWNAQDFVLEDIDRIEVICGPGAAIWGANAVNGVINIITKRAQDTPGALVTVGGGSSDRNITEDRYGASSGKLHYRIFTTEREENSSAEPPGNSALDGWNLVHGGFRTDTDLSSRDKLTVQGDLYEAQDGLSFAKLNFAPLSLGLISGHANQSGGNIEARWDHQFSSGSDLSISYYHDQLAWIGNSFGERRKTDDVSVQRHFRWSDRQDIIGGAEYRYTAERTDGDPVAYFVPANDAEPLFSLFLQDSIALIPHRLTLTVGAKIEHNVFSGFGWDPDIRIAWTPDQRHTLWAAISRADRVPNRSDTGLRWNVEVMPGPGGLPVVVQETGNHGVRANNVTAYEAGLRFQVRKTLLLSVSTFFNSYSNQMSYEPGAASLESDPAPIHIVVPVYAANKTYGDSDGLEASANWKVSSWWTISPGYSLQQIRFRVDANSVDTTSAPEANGYSPEHQAQLRSHFQLPQRFNFDWNTYFVDRLPAQHVAGYTRLDLQLTRRIGKRWQISAAGQNLLADHHTEFQSLPVIFGSSDAKRAAFVKLAWQF
jgi:iron complex outermembrane recepter protein